eukprot:12467373-Alexandrium_andersonii.AAC.1
MAVHYPTTHIYTCIDRKTPSANAHGMPVRLRILHAFTLVCAHTCHMPAYFLACLPACLPACLADWLTG